MKHKKIRKTYYYLRHRVITMNNIVVAAAFIVGVGWAWGAIDMMQRNYALQKEVDAKKRELQLVKLKVQTLNFEQNYFKSSEYQELAARSSLGLADPGEKALILPPNSKDATASNETLKKTASVYLEAPSPFIQWMNFLFGGSRQEK